VKGIIYGICIHKDGNQRSGEVDEAILEGLMEGDLSLDDLACRLLGRHCGKEKE
jgi:hypothetical protein